MSPELCDHPYCEKAAVEGATYSVWGNVICNEYGRPLAFCPDHAAEWFESNKVTP